MGNREADSESEGGGATHSPQGWWVRCENTRLESEHDCWGLGVNFRVSVGIAHSLSCVQVEGPGA